MAQRFLKIAVVYVFLGALLGITMGIRQDFSLVPVHAHILLLGWATLALLVIVGLGLFMVNILANVKTGA